MFDRNALDIGQVCFGKRLMMNGEKFLGNRTPFDFYESIGWLRVQFREECRRFEQICTNCKDLGRIFGDLSEFCSNLFEFVRISSNFTDFLSNLSEFIRI